MENLTVKIHDLSRGGSGVARLETGEVVFVPFTAPGDEVRIRILERKKNYCQGELIEVITPSPSRTTPPCPHFTRCGGCSWQHLPGSLQFETKKKGLLHHLGRAGFDTQALPVDEMPADQLYGYRNRIQLHGNADTGTLGFYELGSKAIVDIASCSIADPRINEKIPFLKSEGLSRFRGEFKLEIDLSTSGEVRAAWNQKHAAYGFRQVNDGQNPKLQGWIADHIQNADFLLDLYGGTGNLSLGLAPRFKRIECVDLFTQAKTSEPRPQNFYPVRQSMDKWCQTPLTPGWSGKSTSVILDPPREGMGRTVDSILKKLETQKIMSLILVGCEVDAFTRDTLHLQKRGYRLVRLGVLDLFPQTPHVESLALFTR